MLSNVTACSWKVFSLRFVAFFSSRYVIALCSQLFWHFRLRNYVDGMLINICINIEVISRYFLAISPFGQSPGGNQTESLLYSFFGFDGWFRTAIKLRMQVFLKVLHSLVLLISLAPQQLVRSQPLHRCWRNWKVFSRMNFVLLRRSWKGRTTSPSTLQLRKCV